MRLLITLFLLILPSLAFADRLETALERCEPYRDGIEDILREYELSPDYFYLALAESTCDVEARSGSGAVGLWQLMPATARHYGLTVNGEDDERLDWRKSTHAAARYLKHLERRFEDFEWVIAAYNMGGTNVARRTGKTRNDGMRIGVLKGTAAYALAKTVDAWRKK